MVCSFQGTRPPMSSCSYFSVSWGVLEALEQTCQTCIGYTMVILMTWTTQLDEHSPHAALKKLAGACSMMQPKSGIWQLLCSAQVTICVNASQMLHDIAAPQVEGKCSVHALSPCVQAHKT